MRMDLPGLLLPKPATLAEPRCLRRSPIWKIIQISEDGRCVIFSKRGKKLGTIRGQPAKLAAYLLHVGEFQREEKLLSKSNLASETSPKPRTWRSRNESY